MPLHSVSVAFLLLPHVDNSSQTSSAQYNSLGCTGVEALGSLLRDEASVTSGASVKRGTHSIAGSVSFPQPVVMPFAVAAELLQHPHVEYPSLRTTAWGNQVL